MAHFAQVEDGIVVSVVPVRNCAIGGCINPGDDVDYQADQHTECGDLEYPETEPLGQAFLASIGLGTGWLQASYNNNFRSAYPGTGWTFDPIADQFVPAASPDTIP
jgi:hypothetical protein